MATDANTAASRIADAPAEPAELIEPVIDAPIATRTPCFIT